LGSWIPTLAPTLIVQLHTKLLVTVRDNCADCNWSTKRLLLHSVAQTAHAIDTKSDTYKQK